jgi:hypothetical protein
MLKSRDSSILAKAAALRINLNLDGAPSTSWVFIFKRTGSMRPMMSPMCRRHPIASSLVCFCSINHLHPVMTLVRARSVMPSEGQAGSREGFVFVPPFFFSILFFQNGFRALYFPKNLNYLVPRQAKDTYPFTKFQIRTRIWSQNFSERGVGSGWRRGGRDEDI